MESIYGDRINASLLDTDFYTFTMMQAVLHQHPDAEVEYEFIERNGEDLVPFISEIRKGIEDLADMQMTDDQLRYLEQKSYMKPDFIRFLGLFRFNLRYIKVSNEDGQLSIKIRGPWLHCIMFEQPVLAMVSEIRNRNVYPGVTLDQVTTQLYKKFDLLTAKASAEDLSFLKVADFATRRRASFLAHNEVVEVMKRDFPGEFVGTSNVHLAREHNITALGTMAHQWLMAYQQLGPRVRDSQVAALDSWVKEYRGDLGIALTDCISSDSFINDFDPYLAKLFDGVRHDSGNPLIWAEKFIAHYKRLGIDPMSKTLIFSDGLSFDVCLGLIKALKGRIKFSFGIGTNLGCDIPGVKPLSIVIKMTQCNGAPVAKISDEPKKIMCRDETYKNYIMSVFGISAA
ncbi:nicotinate phosphoribosyltransferase [Pseudomonas syringae pv. actinidiae]|uniref:nicotinate phosphoribosyltransferase n=1 Tax=Pseudomonas viridiflava TaxID=33069 RepID=UPI0018E5CCD1|nr:nicotinate phosphoribosyltransferase [Pseudomonas viridiflava]MBI6727070.1 nicotinate phosphoribosyltransferase [Pseudomonas viridiflava]MDU8352917.1 nicotinate phosphoribosyltransferase [Pseudomonas syringae pv. actinidiae]